MGGGRKKRGEAAAAAAERVIALAGRLKKIADRAIVGRDQNLRLPAPGARVAAVIRARVAPVTPNWVKAACFGAGAGWAAGRAAGRGGDARTVANEGPPDT